MKKLLLTFVGLLFVFYLACIHYTEPIEVGIRWNPFSGRIGIDQKHGIQFTSPFVLVTKIKTTPTRVCVTSASRSVNCRLVEFNPFYYKELLNTEGFRYYWWDNRISFNMGYKEEYRGVKDLLRGYAFGAQKYPFLETITLYGDDN